MERALRMIAGSIVILAGAAAFGASVIGFAIAQAGPRPAYDAGTAAGWGIFFGAVLAGFGLVLMYRSAASRPESQFPEAPQR